MSAILASFFHIFPPSPELTLFMKHLSSSRSVPTPPPLIRERSTAARGRSLTRLIDMKKKRKRGLPPFFDFRLLFSSGG